LQASGWDVITTSNKASRGARLIDMLKTIITQRRNYSIAQVNIYSGPAFLWAAVVCQLLRQLRKPYVLSLHGGNLPVFAARWPNTVKYILRSAAAVTAPSRYLLEHMSPYRKHVRLVPNGLALDQYAFTLREKPNPFLVWVRAFHKTYNPLLGLTVATLLRDSFPDLRMIMVGPDEGDGTLEEVKDLATKSTLDGRITLSGCISKSEVPTWINKGDIFLNTSRVDNTPVSVLEAMACGLCVVSTNVGGISYLLEDGHDALLVPSNDPSAMAAAVHRILVEPSLAKHLSYNARKKSEQFDWSNILPQWEALLGWASKNAQQ